MNNTHPNAWQEINIDLLDGKDKHQIMKMYNQRTIMVQDLDTIPIYLTGELKHDRNNADFYFLKIGSYKRQFYYQDLEKLIVPK